MNNIQFRKWLAENGTNKKVIGDTISRLKRIEREFSPCDLDLEYSKDHCEKLLMAFSNQGYNDVMDSYPT